jgi:beta-phosphoglucomutase-like phosphatase (HAD superfamily)
MSSDMFPPVRACLFDVDGLLINSEDIYTEAYNNILHSHGRPSLPWSVKALQQSRGRQVGASRETTNPLVFPLPTQQQEIR